MMITVTNDNRQAGSVLLALAKSSRSLARQYLQYHALNWFQDMLDRSAFYEALLETTLATFAPGDADLIWRWWEGFRQRQTVKGAERDAIDAWHDPLNTELSRRQLLGFLRESPGCYFTEAIRQDIAELIQMGLI